MSRLALIALGLSLSVAACSKSAGNQDKVASPPPAANGGGDVIAVPGGTPAPNMGMKKDAEPAAPATAGADDRTKLQPAEGKLAVEAPADAKAGAETVAKITVTPGAGYHVNTEYPVKLVLDSTPGVTLAKAELAAGGHTQGKGDADTFDEKQLALSVKLTPASAGSYTINGTFRFAVCDASQCLPKREAVAITVAAK
ncbi:MAG TPA: hypothetical protein VFP84_36330 [Kofleriaceae bacterium]|nr:hypothetical protein [Kofleriaceae bacterium]